MPSGRLCAVHAWSASSFVVSDLPFAVNVPFSYSSSSSTDLELVRRDVARLLDDALRRVVGRDAADGEASAAVRVHPERRDRRVAVQHLDVFVADAEPVGDDLGQRRLVALTVR